MPNSHEPEYQIQEAINHLRKAGTTLIQRVQEVHGKSVLELWDAGNELQMIADHLEKVREMAARTIVLE